MLEASAHRLPHCRPGAAILTAMYAIIVGAGEVGFHIATILSQEGHDVAVIDRDQDAHQRAVQQLDCLAVHGNGASRRVLEEAGVGRADLLVAVTDSDEVNMIACMAAKGVGVPLTAARVRNQEYLEDSGALSTGIVGVDQVIEPEMAVAAEVIKLAAIPGALDVETFVAGQVSVIEVLVDAQSPCVGVPLRSLELPSGVLVAAILREGKTSIPRGDSTLQGMDRVFLSGKAGATVAAAGVLSGQQGALKNAILLGCGEIGMNIARGLESRHIRLTVFEKDQAQAVRAADVLRHSMVIRDEGIDENVLIEEGVKTCDLFIAATGDDRLNILTALMAKQLGAKRTIAVVERSEFSRVVESVGVDVALSPRRMTASAILRFIRAGSVVSGAVLDKSAGEALEFLVKDSCPVCSKKLAEIDFPNGAIVGAVVRGDEVRIPDGQSVLVDGDTAVVFALPEAVRGVEKLFATRSRR
ncbi:MAG: Trk system potassium transporter TrkA [Thermoleophilia bacterium]|nr:Trk system potassium transporter TrkA [Thermoleophilia bacterium]